MEQVRTQAADIFPESIESLAGGLIGLLGEQQFGIRGTIGADGQKNRETEKEGEPPLLTVQVSTEIVHAIGNTKVPNSMPTCSTVREIIGLLIKASPHSTTAVLIEAENDIG